MTGTARRSLELVQAIAAKLNAPIHGPASQDTRTRTLQYIEAIARSQNLLEPAPGMATVTYTIGTSSRDYSTISSWESDLDNGALYSSGDDAVGQPYNDSAFAESVEINGGGTIGLNSVTLTVPSSERHDGTAGSGARIVISSAPGSGVILKASSALTISVEWLEIDGNGVSNTFGGYQAVNASANERNVLNCIIHGVLGSRDGRMYGLQMAGGNCSVENTIIYDIENTRPTGQNATGLDAGSTTQPQNYDNLTIHNIIGANSSADTYCVKVHDSSSKNYRNIIATDPSGGGSNECFDDTSLTSSTASNNLSSDATASGTGAVTSAASSDQFVSTVSGSEDLHLKSGADAIDAGTDLGTTANVDIDGRDRDAEGDTWDIGAHEFVSGGGGPAAGFPFHLYYSGGSDA